MIDYHTHILPGIDDGARNTAMALAMLEEEVNQGVTTVCLTPHFYANEASPSHFLAKREEAYEKLMASADFPFPGLRLGAEVYYFDGIDHVDSLSRLCLQGTNLLLLEMPFEKWSDRQVNSILHLAGERGFTVMLAHVDRYMDFNNPGIWKYLRDKGVILQVNTSFLTSRGTRRKAVRMLRNKEIDIFASDCHNMTGRMPDIKEASEIVSKRLGDVAIRIAEQRGHEIMELSGL